MTEFVNCHNLKVAANLKRFVDEDVLPGTGLNPEVFWADFDSLVHDLAPINRELLAERDRLQSQLDKWHKSNPGPVTDMPAYIAFLDSIGYLQQVPDQVQATTSKVDSEISEQAGPQLVVPAANARYALNAANARWGSLYDALYGTDAISSANGAEIKAGYNPLRGAKVIAFARALLDEAAPLATGSHVDATAYAVDSGALIVSLANGSQSPLAQPEKYVGYQGDAAQPKAILLKNHGLHIEIQIDPASAIGSTDPAGIKDLLLEAALSTIIDCEDSVAAVDADETDRTRRQKQSKTSKDTTMSDKLLTGDGRTHIKSKLMRESLQDRAVIGGTDSNKDRRILPDITMLSLGGQSIFDRGAAAIVPVAEEIAELLATPRASTG